MSAALASALQPGELPDVFPLHCTYLEANSFLRKFDSSSAPPSLRKINSVLTKTVRAL